MPARVGGLVAIIVALLIVTVLFWRGCRSESEITPEAIGDFEASNVVVQSPDLEVALRAVRGTDHAEYTDWAFVFECREAGGCRAQLRLEVDYLSGGEKRRLGITGVVDADRGKSMRIARIQRPAVVIDQIEKVTVTVEAPHASPSALPTPMQ